MQYPFITIEGNIGAGKTTLANRLSLHYNARLILEQFADNPFLPKFYENPQQFAFPLELFFMAERFKQLKDFLTQTDLFQQVTISDYLFTKSLLFAKNNLAEDEYRLYQRIFDIIYLQLPKPDILIYLHAPVEKLQANIKKRNRSYEQQIPNTYLLEMQDIYFNYLKQYDIPTLYVDVHNADFITNDTHFHMITAILEKGLTSNRQYLSLP